MLYEMIYNSSNHAIIVHDMETGEILTVNAKACELWGYNKEEIVKLDIETLSFGEPPHIQRESSGFITKAAGGIPQLFAWKCKKKNGELFSMEVDLKIREIDGKKCVLLVERDIIERKQAEKILERSRHLLQTIIDISPFHVICLDFDGKYIVANKSYCEHFGTIPDEIGERHYSQVLPPRLAEKHKAFVDSALSGEIVEFEDANLSEKEFFQYAYGVYTPFKNVNGEIQGCVVYVVDITEIKKAEESLRQAHDLLEERVKVRTKALESSKKCLEEVNSVLNVLLSKRDEEKKQFEKNVLFYFNPSFRKF
ncbi:MAG: PAS domain-containing protein [Desulfamplus sp.]|nr:PAS domain-containing protein [Desulfamplus sp.]